MNTQKMLRAACLAIAAFTFWPGGGASIGPAIDPAPAVNTAAAADIHPLAGTWYGLLQSADGTVQRFLVVRHPDGRFEMQLRIYKHGEPMHEIRNAGLWGASGSLLVTVTTHVNGKPVSAREPAYSSVYLVKQFEGKTLRYEHLASGRQLETIRVTPRASLPD